MAKTLNDLNDFINETQKEYGAGSAQLGSDFKGIDMERWPVTSPLISHILGGGIPKGRVIEIYGPESSGKTSLACYLAGEAQRTGENVLYIDAENAADLEYAESFGLLRNKVVLNQPSSGEEGLNIAQKAAESGIIKFIIIDSVAALTPQAEIDGEMGDQQMGAQARLMGKALRKLSGVCGKNKVTIIFINQLRDKLGVIYGNPECVTPDTLVDIF